MRIIDQVIVDYLKTRKPFKYGHLIKFERPIISSQELDTSDKEYVYLTDMSNDTYFNDPRVDTSTENLTNKYRANRVLSVPPIQEYSEARATSLDLKLDANAIGAYLADTAIVTGGSGTFEFEFSKILSYDKGFVEGDKIQIEVEGFAYSAVIIKFPDENVIRVETEDDIPLGTNDVYITLTSQELVSILQDKTSPYYASFINREVELYKIFIDEEGNRIGTPYYLYKGIIQDVSLEDDEDSVTVNWTLNSHWGDFAEVRGRLTTDEFHRAIDARGVPQPESAIKKAYAYDKGFIHADTAIHVEATYTVQVEKQNVKYKKGFFGIGAKVKVKKYYEDEERQTELDFQLQGKTLDVIYGVRPSEGFPIFADTLNTDSSKVYVCYAISEGEIGGIYDVIIQDKSLICSNEADFDSRSSQTPENSIDVVCYGRADRGDVLEGITSTTNTRYNFYDTDNLTYYNAQSLSYLANANGFTQPLGTFSGTVGVLHENSIKLDTPINMTLSVYTGRSNQRAAPNLVDIARNGNFKIQSDYWTGPDKMEYWGPNHRMLDTAYVGIEYIIAENETTIPSVKYIVKGKFVECFNYDNSYQHDHNISTESHTDFEAGDYVDIYDQDDNLLNSNNRILRKFAIRDRNGVLQYRFALESTPSLNHQNGIPSTTRFYMRNSSGQKWTMLTYNYKEDVGYVAETTESPVVGIAPEGSGGIDLVLAPNSPITNLPGSAISGREGFLYGTSLRIY